MVTKKKTSTPKVKPAPVATPTVAAAPAAKGSGVPKVVVVIIAVVVGLFVLGFMLTAGASFFLGKSLLNSFGVTKVVPGIDGSKTVTVGNGKDSVTVSSSTTWPTTMPSNVPKYSAGTITSSSRVNDAWTVTVGNTNAVEATAYRAAVVAKGWTIDSDMNYNNSVSWSATQGTQNLSFTYSDDDKSVVLSAYTTPASSE